MMKNNTFKMQSDKPLLTKLRRLVELDTYYETEPDNPEPYRERALIFQSLGIHTIARFENKLCALKENRSDLNFYDYYIEYNKTELSKYISESNTQYYKYISNISQVDYYFLSSVSAIKIKERANILSRIGLYNMAMRDYDFILSNIQPHSNGYAEASFSKSLILNLLGNFKEGWKLYEKRWDIKQKISNYKLDYPCPRWQGELQDDVNLKGYLLIYSEQGIGDSIQFIRYAIYLKSLGFNILVWNNMQIDDFLRFNLSSYNIPCVTENMIENLAYEIPMMSLPYICKMELNNIPLTSKYLVAERSYIEKWRKKITSKNLKVGIFWESISNINGEEERNINLEVIEKIFNLDISFYCLQKNIKDEDLDIIRKYNNVFYYHTKMESFLDTSAIIEHLDLVISIDTAVAHLSAAMGKPTWILLNYAPDFRWLLNRDDSIWYDSVRLFRQDLDYRWDNVIDNVYENLNNLGLS